MEGNCNLGLLHTIEAALPIDGLRIPPPALHPNERLRRRLCFRNERNFHRQASALSGKNVLTTFAPASGYKVIDQDEWWSDGWSPEEFARVLAPNAPFFEQFRALSREIPHCALRTSQVENSYYSNYALHLKDCYLVYGASDLEGCMYSRAVTHCRDVVDALVAEKCELCYEIIACEDCYQAVMCGYCSNCRDCSYCWNCRSCTNCFLCTGLERAEYCVRNESVGKVRYFEYLASLGEISAERTRGYEAELDSMRGRGPRQLPYMRNSEDCTGDFVIESARCTDCADIFRCEDSAFLSWIQNARSSHDCTLAVPDGVQFCFECCSTTGCRTSLGLFSCWNCSDSFYSMECNGCRNIFGCIGLRSKEYCLLNRQMRRDEYLTAVREIIGALEARGEWARFFPADCSWYGYNQTIAQEYLPLSRQSALSGGFQWHEEEALAPPHAATSENPLLRVCVSSGKPFKLNPRELDLYKIFRVPTPLLHPDERHRRRIERRYLDS